MFFKTGAIGYDPFIPGTPFADPSYKPFTHNVDKAKALLDQAYKNGVPSPATFTMYTDESRSARSSARSCRPTTPTSA